MSIPDVAGITPLAMADGGELSEGEVYLQRLVDAKNEVMKERKILEENKARLQMACCEVGATPASTCTGCCGLLLWVSEVDGLSLQVEDLWHERHSQKLETEAMVSQVWQCCVFLLQMDECYTSLCSLKRRMRTWKIF